MDIENESNRVAPGVPEAVPAVTAGYAAVRFNALKHGILSRSTVLPHEDATEYRHLLEAMLDEHRPAGATEAHLVEELASILWRKRRVLQAEGARINQGLESVVRNTASLASSAAPFAYGLEGKRVDIRELMDQSPEDVAECQRDAQKELAATERAAVILRRGGKGAFDQALRALTQSSREWWAESLADDAVEPTADGLGNFISQELDPVFRAIEAEARYHEAIKSQAIGEGLKAQNLEHLGRYETHLDRKFERTLAMLIKLKEIRRQSAPQADGAQ